MGQKSSIDRLEPEIKAYIQAMLASGGVTLNELIADLQQRFPIAAQAGVLPSRSALGRFGQKLERRLSNVRATTEAMRLVREHAGDEMDARSEALMAMIQTELFDAMMALQEADDPELDAAKRLEILSNAGKHLATLTSGSVRLKRYQAEAEERGRKKLLEEQRAKLEAYADTPEGVLLALAVQELAANLPRIENLVLTPDLIAPVLTRLGLGKDAA